MGDRLSARAALGAALAAALALAGCGRGGPGAPAAGGGPAPATARAPAAPGGAAALAPATAADVMARVRAPGAPATLVNVWASWCAPCREEFPALLAVARERRPQGLRVVLVSADFDSAAAQRYLTQHAVDFPSLFKTGDDLSLIDSLSTHWSGALPATFVYDARGRLVRFWEGAADRGRFEAAVDAALARPAAAR